MARETSYNKVKRCVAENKRGVYFKVGVGYVPLTPERYMKNESFIKAYNSLSKEDKHTLDEKEKIDKKLKKIKKQERKSNKLNQSMISTAQNILTEEERYLQSLNDIYGRDDYDFEDSFYAR